MLVVRTKVLPSPIEGYGLFADEDITAGQVIWQFKSGFDMMLHKVFVDSLSYEAKKQVIHYGFREGDIYWLDADDARFFNTSKTPNTETRAVGYNGNKEYIPNILAVVVAAVNIKAGEEITCNYGEFDQDYTEDFSIKEGKV